MECGENATITMSKVKRLVKRTDYKELKTVIDKLLESDVYKLLDEKSKSSNDKGKR